VRSTIDLYKNIGIRVSVGVTTLHEEEKAEKRASILKAIESSGLAELEDAELRKALNDLKAAHALKKTVQHEPGEDQKTAS
jgi:hypothetical protein